MSATWMPRALSRRNRYPTPQTSTRTPVTCSGTWVVGLVMLVRARRTVRPAGAADDVARHRPAVHVHVRGARHARVEAADRPEHVDALEVLGLLVVLQQRRR